MTVDTDAVRMRELFAADDPGDDTAYVMDFLRDSESASLPSCGNKFRLILLSGRQADLDSAAELKKPSLKSLLAAKLILADSADVAVNAIGLEKSSYGHSGFRGSIGAFLEKARDDMEEARGAYPAHLQAKFDRFHSIVSNLLTGAEDRLDLEDVGEVALVVRDPSGLSCIRQEFRWARDGVSTWWFERTPFSRSWDENIDLSATIERRFAEGEAEELSVAAVADFVNAARKIVVLSGAGASVDSGIPPFRSNTASAPSESGRLDAAAIWTTFNPDHMTQSNFNATPHEVVHSLENAGAWWEMKRGLYPKFKAAAPNPTHSFFARLAAERRTVRGIITQNIDSLHVRAAQDAGIADPLDSPEYPYVELHGHMRTVICSNRKTNLNPIPFGAGDCEFVVEDPSETARCFDATGEPGFIPRCPKCRSPLRTETVMFGQPMPEGALNVAGDMMGDADLVFVIGTSLIVKPASLLPTLALSRGVPVVMVNLHPTQYDDWSAGVVRQPSGRFFHELMTTIFGDGPKMTSSQS